MRIVKWGDDLWGDARGWGTNPWRGSGIDPEGPLACHVVSIEPGAVRGNHLHPDAQEWMLLFGAPCTVAGRRGGTAGADNRAGTTESLRLEGSRPTLVHFPAGEAHAVRGEGPGTTFLVAFNDHPAPETERVEALLEPRPLAAGEVDRSG